jgi:hypothetical protein
MKIETRRAQIEREKEEGEVRFPGQPPSRRTNTRLRYGDVAIYEAHEAGISWRAVT